MVQLLPEQAPQGWDAIAESYERTVMRYFTRCAEDVLRLADIKSGERVLDVATGPGTCAILAARAGAQVIATDFSPRMIERLSERIAAEKLTSVTAALMDGQALDLPDGSFDAAVSLFGLIFFPDRAKGFGELRRVLRTGGRVAVGVWGAPEKMGLSTVFRRALMQAIPDLPPPSGPALIFCLADPQRLEGEMRESGFRDIGIQTRVYGFEFPSPEEASEGLRGINPAAAALLERLSPAKRDEVRDALTGLLRRDFGNGPVRLTAEAHIAVGVK